MLLYTILKLFSKTIGILIAAIYHYDIVLYFLSKIFLRVQEI